MTECVLGEGGVCGDGGRGGEEGKDLGGGAAHVSIPLPPSIPSLSPQPPPLPLQSLFVTASHSGSVEPGIVHLIRSLMHF